METAQRELHDCTSNQVCGLLSREGVFGFLRRLQEPVT